MLGIWLVLMFENCVILVRDTSPEQARPTKAAAHLEIRNGFLQRRPPKGYSEGYVVRSPFRPSPLRIHELQEESHRTIRKQEHSLFCAVSGKTGQTPPIPGRYAFQLSHEPVT